MPPLNLVLAGCAVALLVVLLLLRLRRREPRDSSTDRLDTVAAWPPSGIRILSLREREAFAILRQALPEYAVLAQVPLARFMRVPKRHSYAEWMRRVGHQCADLVVCDGATEVIAVIDIQPAPTAQTERSQRRHQRVARALEAAKIPLYVWPEGQLPSPLAARAQVLPKPKPAAPVAVARPEAASPVAVPAATAAAALAAAGPSPFDEDERDSSWDERIEMREPPPSTWFDEFDTAPAPLAQDKDR